MSYKRPIIPNVYTRKKRLRLTEAQGDPENETKKAIEEIGKLFPVNAFEGRLPKIVMKHQLYSMVKSKTQCDKELGILRNSYKVKLFKMGNDADEFAVLFTEDYRSLVLKLSSPVVENFITKVVDCSPDVSYTKDQLLNLSIQEDDVKQLIKFGLLTIRDINSWWLAIPGAGEFVKTFIKGRRHVLHMVRKSKYGEILHHDLLRRKLHKEAKLGLQYHIHDVIGAELVKCIDTTSGMLIRINDS